MSENVEKDVKEGRNVDNEDDVKDLRDKTQSEEVNEMKAGSYWLTRIVFLRFLAFIYLVAFMVSYHQNKELIGDRGLTPARLYLRGVVIFCGQKDKKGEITSFISGESGKSFQN